MGPLAGFKVIEIAGIGPGQFCGMLLADMGASLVRIERVVGNDAGMPAKYNLMNRSRPTIGVDLKSAAGVELVLKLCESADALFEGFRPGVMERLGIAPGDCMARNEKLVYGRMTGWGQSGPLANAVGHDGNYAALAGVIGAIGEKDGPPSIPLNLTADFGGGGAFLAIGILAALLEAQRSGKGQVVDAAMVDGAASLMTLFYGLHAAGLWKDSRGSNLLDGGAPFYRAYRTSDQGYVIVCALEPRFFKSLLDALGIEDIEPGEQFAQRRWPQQIEKFEKIFAGKTRDEWCELLEGTEACFAPVLTLSEAPSHEHMRARETFVDVDGIRQPAPAPRFSRTVSEIGRAAGEADANIRRVLSDWGLSMSEIDDLAVTR
ncbi:MAG: CaiB/BaiF CoA-transferase family protein [Woeseiaceae bacterium]|nr:CaiB/BaiF CoA-transferase family protein [Woeseiaceae bacterium]